MSDSTAQTVDSKPLTQSADQPADQTVKQIIEGSARIPYTGDEGVFYNKVQVFNRDLSICAISTFAKIRRQELIDRFEKRVNRYEERMAKQTTSQSTNQSTDQSTDIKDVDMTPSEPSATQSAASSTTQPFSPLDHFPKFTRHDPDPNTGIRILEALSATGLRSIRYINEIPSVNQIVVNDFDQNAVQLIESNLKYNREVSPSSTEPNTQSPSLMDRLIPNCGDAKLVMYQTLGHQWSEIDDQPTNHSISQSSSSTVNRTFAPFHVVDLDPYGSASEFLDAAVQSVTDGGLLCVTCTDKAVLCGSWGEVSYAKYGGYALRGKICHESALRLLLGAISNSASKYRRKITPVLSLSIDFYVRVFVRVFETPSGVKFSACKMGLAYQCQGCHSFEVQPLGKFTVKSKQQNNQSINQSNDESKDESKDESDDKPKSSDKTIKPVPKPTTQSINQSIEQAQTTGGFVHHTPATNLIDRGCPHCQSSYKIGGPLWIDELHDRTFVRTMIEEVETRSNQSNEQSTEQSINQSNDQSINQSGNALVQSYRSATPRPAHYLKFATTPRMLAMLNLSLNEITNPFYYSMSDICQTLHLTPPKTWLILAALQHLGYEHSATHCLPDGFKTNAPGKVVWDIFRTLFEQKPELRSKQLKENTPGFIILATKSTSEGVSFEYVEGCDRSAKVTGQQKFYPNPETHWGPKARAVKRKADDEAADPNDDPTSTQSTSLSNKSRVNQGKRKKLNKLCIKFDTTGDCRFGDNCKFSHDLALRTTKESTTEQPKQTATEQ